MCINSYGNTFIISCKTFFIWPFYSHFAWYRLSQICFLFYYFHRITLHTEEKEGHFLSVPELYDTYSQNNLHPATKSLFCKTIHSIYSTVQNVTKRCKDNYLKRVQVLSSLKLRESSDETLEELFKRKYGQATQINQKIFVTLTSEDVCDGIRATKEVVITITGTSATVECTVFGHPINLEFFCVNQIVDSSPDSVDAALTAIHLLKFCHGVSTEDLSDKVWSSLGEEKQRQKHCASHSKNCLGLVPVTSLTQTCQSCLRSAANKLYLTKVVKRPVDCVQDDNLEGAVQNLEDLSTLLRQLGFQEDSALLIFEQAKNVAVCNPRQRRWHPR